MINPHSVDQYSEALSERKLVLAFGPQMEGVIVQLASHTSNLEAPSIVVIAGTPDALPSGEVVMPHTV
jgi:hypothetical protein